MLKQIGKYTISERIGRGTYSRVYRAVDPQGRSVAIKVSTTQTEPEHLDQFQKDLVAAASVLHPSLVAVHDLGFEDEFPYLVMELVEGHDLDQLLKSNHAPALAERIRIMEQIAGALKAAHERGVFHLDVRPTKIMRTEDGTAKLLDLGLGRLSYDPARVTEHGYLVGAPFYMSPERLTAIDTADERCDIWSFGVTFYEWLAGRHPFFDDDGERMIGNIMDERPAELQNVPAALNHLIFRAMEKDPHDRYRNFSDLLADLQPMMTDLKREESDALMAEALKQTDSGRWHEARRIARKLRDLEPEQAAGGGSQVFGVSGMDEAEPEPARPTPTAAPQVAAAAAAAAAVAVARSAIAVDTPEPAPAAAPEPEFYQEETVEPPLPVARIPQRPERTPPKIPPMGLRNGGTPKPENGAAPGSTRPAANGTHTPAPSAPPKATITRESVGRERRSESRPARPATPPPPQPVRILEEPESSGFPWARILGFTIPVLLLLGAGYFFLSSNGKLGRGRGQETNAGNRVIATGGADGAQRSPASDITPHDDQDANRAAANTNNPGANNPTAATTGANPLGPEATNTAPRSFDAKSLSTKLPVPGVKGKNNSNTQAMKGVSAPSFSGAAAADNGDVAGTSLRLSPAPPPPPAPAAVKQAAAPAPASPVVSPVKTALAPPAVVTSPGIPTGGVYAAPVLIHEVKPVYPPQAVQRKVQGLVKFQATIAKDGSLKNIQLLSGDPMLNIAARQAVSQFKYRPATLNGDPVEVSQTIVLKFGLNDR